MKQETYLYLPSGQGIHWKNGMQYWINTQGKINLNLLWTKESISPSYTISLGYQGYENILIMSHSYECEKFQMLYIIT